MFGFRVMGLLLGFAFGICFPRAGFVRLYKIHGPVNKYLDRRGAASPPRLGMTRIWRMRGTIVAFLIVAGSLAWRGAPAIAADPEPRAILAPSGVLRTALYTGTPTSIL
jgi:hypothetical protein